MVLASETDAERKQTPSRISSTRGRISNTHIHAHTPFKPARYDPRTHTPPWPPRNTSPRPSPCSAPTSHGAGSGHARDRASPSRPGPDVPSLGSATRSTSPPRPSGSPLIAGPSSMVRAAYSASDLNSPSSNRRARIRRGVRHAHDHPGLAQSVPRPLREALRQLLQPPLHPHALRPVRAPHPVLRDLIFI